VELSLPPVLFVLDAGAGALTAGEDAPLAGVLSVVLSALDDGVVEGTFAVPMAGGLVVSFVVPVPEAGRSDPAMLTEEADALPLCVAFVDEALLSPPPPPPPPHAACSTLAATASVTALNRMKRKAGAPAEAKFVIVNAHY
jgi:hypothetical protein